MRLSLILVLLLATSPLAAQSTSKPEAIIAQENLFWTAYTHGDIDSLRQLLLPEFTSVEQEIWTRAQVLDFVKQFFAHCSLGPVNLIEPHVVFLTPDIATIVYHATESPTCGTRTMSGQTNISTVWLKREGHWRMHLHTEYAVPPK